MANREYHRQYRKTYWNDRKQVSVVIPLAEYRKVEKDAKAGGRTVGQQIWAECQAYRQGEFVPPQVMENRLDEITRILRGIGNNINQMAHHSNSFKKLVGQNRVLEQLSNLEREADRLIRSAWNPTE